MTTFQGRVPELGRCSSCGAVALLDSFRSRDDLRRYKAGDLCQECQDVASAGVAGPDQLKWGAVVGFGTRGPDDLLAGGTRNSGSCRSASSPRAAGTGGSRGSCAASVPVLVRSTRGTSWSRWRAVGAAARYASASTTPSDQCLVEHLSQFALVVGPYRDWLVSAIGRFPALAHSVSVDLCAELDWNRRSAYALVPLWRLGWAVCPFVPRADEPCSALRACALVAAALEDVGAFPGSPGRPMDLLLDAVPLRAERVSAGQAS